MVLSSLSCLLLDALRTLEGVIFPAALEARGTSAVATSDHPDPFISYFLLFGYLLFASLKQLSSLTIWAVSVNGASLCELNQAQRCAVQSLYSTCVGVGRALTCGSTGWGKLQVHTLILYFLFPRERRHNDQLPVPGSLAIQGCVYP